MKFTHALKWSFLGELSAKAVSPIVFLILARLMTPADYGVMASALMVIAFSQIFWEAGMAKALIQRQSKIEEAANFAFVINIVFGMLIALMLYSFAEPIALTIFQDSRVTLVLQVMTIQILFGALSSVQTALMEKQMGFKKLFWVRLATIAIPALASIPLALNGWGYWALVAGTLTGQFFQVIILWRMSHWRPKLIFDTLVTREIAKFGGWVAVTGLLSWFFAWADSMVVGHYLGSHDLGLFNTGSKLPVIVYTMIFGPILPVLYSQLSRMSDDKNKMREYAELTVSVLTIIALPIALFIYIFSNHIETMIFGEKWVGVGVVLGLMSLMHGFSWIVGMNGEFYRAMGKPSYETIVTGGTLFVYLSVYLMVINSGLDKFVWARMFLAIGALFLHLALLRITLKVDVFKIILKIITIIAISLIGIIPAKIAVMALFSREWIQLFVGGLVAALIIILLVYFLEKDGDIAKIRAGLNYV